jgi:glycosyltransferase involved in cell wall biosynthesis
VTVVAKGYKAVCKGAEHFALGTKLPSPPAGPETAQGKGRLRVCYVGNLGWAYRLETCIEAIERLAREGVAVELDVAGDGPQRGLVEAAERKGVPVHYCGMLNGDGLDALLRECAMGIVPMVSETAVGIPNKLCDYAAHGLGIVSSLGGESRGLIEKFGAGAFYRADDPTSLATVLKNCWREPECLAAMRKGSRRMAEETFDAEKIYPAFARRVRGLCRRTAV